MVEFMGAYAQFVRIVMMAAAVLFCLALLCFKPLPKSVVGLPAKTLIKRQHGFCRCRCQLLHHRQGLAFRWQAFQHLKYMALVIIEHGHKALAPVIGGVTAIKQARANQDGIDL